MKKYFHVAALLIASTTVLFAASPALSANVDVGINIGVPVYVEPPRPVYVQPRPVYIQPQHVIVETQPVYVEQDDRYWDCKNEKCKHKKNKKEKHHKHDRDDD
jgi:hypothetical protein